MDAANYIAPGRIEYRPDATRPQPAAGEVLVAVEACGICGSDLHMYRNDSHRESLVRRTPEGYQVPGHEFAGRVADLGAGVSGWSRGDRVVGVTGMGGGMAQFVTVPVNPFQIVAIPDGVDFAAAATTEPLADALQMVRKAAIRPEENVVVFGVGIIGLGVIQAIRAKGVSPARIIAVDIHDLRLRTALQIGATHCVNAAREDVFGAVAAICGREESYWGESAGVGVVFDCAGYIKHIKGPPPLETALRLVSPHTGRIVCFGAYEDKLLIDLAPLVNKQPTIIGSNGYAAAELAEALELMRSGSVDRTMLISHTYPLQRVHDAFERQGHPDAIKVMLRVTPASPSGRSESG